MAVDRLSKFQFLDSFRGVLAFFVIIGHWTHNTVWAINDQFPITVGVMGFFALSSFLLTYRLLTELMMIMSENDKSVEKKLTFTVCAIVKFGIRRFARIYPLYIFVAVLVKYGSSYTYNAFPGLINVNFWEILTTYNSGTWITWTIHVEVTSYLFIPFTCVMAALCGRNLRWLPIVVLLVAVIYCDINFTEVRFPIINGQRCYHHCDDSNGPKATYILFWPYASAFFMPSAIAIIYYWTEEYARNACLMKTCPALPNEATTGQVFENFLPWHVRYIINVYCYLLCIGFMIVTSNRYKILVTYFNIRPLLFNYPAYHWSIVIFLALISRGSFVHTFNTRFWNHAGKTSYSIYLTHFIYKHNLVKYMPGWYFDGFEGVGTYVIVTMIGSTITYHLIEYPGMWLGIKLCQGVDRLFKHFVTCMNK